MRKKGGLPVNFILVSSALEKKMAKKLSDFGTVVPLPPLPALPSPIASHADTLIASVGDEFFVYANYPESDKLFAALDFPCTVIKRRKQISARRGAQLLHGRRQTRLP